MRRRLLSGLAAAAITLVTGPAIGAWPDDKPIKFVIPYGPGGGFDTIVRVFEPEVEKVLDAQLVPDNISGAGGARGAATVARSAPDGYTIGIFNMPGFTITQLTGGNLGFDLDKVTWIANLASEAYGIAVKADSPIKSMKDLCSLGRPARLSEVGHTSTSYVTGEIAFSVMNCPAEQVTGYKGSNAAMIGVIRGDVDATLKPVSSMKKYVESGDLRLLTTFTDKPIVEGVPTTTELGYPELAKLDVHRVIAGPPGLPADVQKRLSEAFVKAANSPEIQKWAEQSGTDLNPKGHKETAKMVQDMGDFYAKYKDVLVDEPKR